MLENLAPNLNTPHGGQMFRWKGEAGPTRFRFCRPRPTTRLPARCSADADVFIVGPNRTKEKSCRIRTKLLFCRVGPLLCLDAGALGLVFPPSAIAHAIRCRSFLRSSTDFYETLHLLASALKIEEGSAGADLRLGSLRRILRHAKRNREEEPRKEGMWKQGWRYCFCISFRRRRKFR